MTQLDFLYKINSLCGYFMFFPLTNVQFAEGLQEPWTPIKVNAIVSTDLIKWNFNIVNNCDYNSCTYFGIAYDIEQYVFLNERWVRY